jgi:hypothetical protein
MNASAAYGLLAYGLIFGALVTLLPLGLLRRHAALGATALALLGGIAPALHGIFGMPSMSLLAIALLQLAERPASLSPRFALLILLPGIALYALPVTLAGIDLYGLGYQPVSLLVVVAVFGLLLWQQRHYRLLGILSTSLAAYAAGLFDNLWDALIDPLLILLALCILLRHAVFLVIAARHR